MIYEVYVFFIRIEPISKGYGLFPYYPLVNSDHTGAMKNNRTETPIPATNGPQQVRQYLFTAKVP